MRKPGRPPSPDGRHDAQIQLRVSKERKARYATAAKRAGKTLSAWILGVLDGG